MSVKICLAAIFKNESNNVNRCLDAVKEIIDYVSIVDTGSTDNTVKLIKKWGINNNIPTKVHYDDTSKIKFYFTLNDRELLINGISF